MAKATEPPKESIKNKILENVGTRLFIICVLILLLNIPLGMVKGVTMSRVYLFDSTVREISQDWGGEQTIIAPIMNIPVKFVTESKVYNQEKKIYEKITNVYEHVYRVLPENLNIKAEIDPEVRHRGIFDVLVHSTKVNISGNFENPDLSFIEGNYKILWEKSFMSIGINPSLIRGDTSVKLGNEELKLDPGSRIDHISGISANVDLSKGMEKTFEFSFQFNGSSDISFAPLGKKNVFEAKSVWPHPTFSNTFRPQSPEITDDGFVATWNIPYIARNYPQIIKTSTETQQLRSNLATVGLYDTMPVYKKSQRLASYGTMFIALTFIMMFLFERKLKQNLHYIQYVVIGLAISLFFLTTTSLSEYMSFGLAYIIASLIVILMISLYIFAALKNKKIAITGGLLMAILYGILYLMLSEAEYALLIGTFILLLTMSAVMWATRNINTQSVE